MNIVLTGAAGFIGSNLATQWVAAGHRVLGIDNLSRGTQQNLGTLLHSPLFQFQEIDISIEETLFPAVALFHHQYPVDEVWHMAANSDIPAGVADAAVDLKDTFMTTYTLLQVMKKLCIKKLAFASSSAIYGHHTLPLKEHAGPFFPISNYGAMKLASEGLISAATEQFLDHAWIFRFPNVVGTPSTHGVILDFMRKLRTSPSVLPVLGDGTQQKPYVHVSELMQAMHYIVEQSTDALNYFNISAQDEGITVADIAAQVVACIAPNASIQYGNGNKGWVGDVPRFSYSIEKLERLGWQPELTSKQAIQKAVLEIAQQEQWL